MFYPVAAGKQEIVKDGLVLWLDANDKTSYPGSGTTWKDMSGYRNNCTLNNSPTFNTDGRGCILFDGINEYGQVEHSDSLYITTSYSVEFWFKNVGSTGNLVLWEKGVNKSIVQPYPSGTFYLHYNQTSNQTNAELLDGNWKHIFTTWDKPNQFGYFYLNGILKSSGSLGTGDFPNTDFMQIMGRVPQNAFFINGKMAVWRMYNKYFTQQEILQNYNATKDRFGL